MYTGFIFKRFNLPNRVCFYCLFALWILGLLAGIILAVNFSAKNTDITWDGLFSKPAMICSFITSFSPIVIIWLSRHYRCFWPIVPVLFTSGALRGFCGMFLFYNFSSGAWFIRGLYLFSGTFVSVLMWWLLLCRKDIPRLSFLAILVSLITILDFTVASPFLSHLSIYF